MADMTAQLDAMNIDRTRLSCKICGKSYWDDDFSYPHCGVCECTVCGDCSRASEHDVNHCLHCWKTHPMKCRGCSDNCERADEGLFAKMQVESVIASLANLRESLAVMKEEHYLYPQVIATLDDACGRLDHCTSFIPSSLT